MEGGGGAAQGTLEIMAVDKNKFACYLLSLDASQHHKMWQMAGMAEETCDKSMKTGNCAGVRKRGNFEVSPLSAGAVNSVTI